MRLTLVFAAIVLAAPGLELVAQGDRVRLELMLPARLAVGAGGPSVTTSNLLADANTRELLRNGFPAALHFRAELWKKSRWFDEPAGVSEWNVLVRYDAASELYRVVRQRGPNESEDFGGFATLASAEAQIDKPYRIPLQPERPGRYYYSLSLEIQTLTVSDLDALQRWLRGEARPAVRGKGNPLTALRNGVETLLSRVLGGENRQYEQRSGIFSVN